LETAELCTRGHQRKQATGRNQSARGLDRLRHPVNGTHDHTIEALGKRLSTP
jgi:hypothetical protein